MISLSIVSHQQFHLVKNILKDLEKYCAKNIPIELILTINLPEELPSHFDDYHYPIKLIQNIVPKGFGENHNAAFRMASYSYFCVLNPDIRLLSEPFIPLINHLKNHPNLGVIAPQIIDEKNSIQDNARRFLTPQRLIRRMLGRTELEYHDIQECIYPDWVAGMFLLFPSEIYEKINGFDERYFLYCEDMDICLRLRDISYEVCILSFVKVVHCAQKESHRNIKYLFWHLSSIMKFFWVWAKRKKIVKKDEMK